MSCLCEKGLPHKKWRSLLESYTDFETFVHIIKHSLQGHILKVLKVSQQRQTILVLFFLSTYVA